MARSTNGTTDVINFGNLSGILSTGDGSMAIWIKMASAVSANYRSIFSSGTSRGGGGNDNFNFEVNALGDPNPNTFSVQVTQAGFGANSIFMGAADTNWHSMGMSYKSSNTTVTGYLDGINKGSASSVIVRTNPSISTTIGAGHNSVGALTEFCDLSGAADAAIWSVTLTDAEFLALGLGARPYRIRPASLIFWAPIDGLQSPEPDLSGLFNNGTLTGTALASGPPTMMFTPRWPQVLLPAIPPVFVPWAQSVM